jgi:hypothetical protein
LAGVTWSANRWPSVSTARCVAAGRKADPTAAILDSRTLRSTPESGPRAGYDGAKRKRGSKLQKKPTLFNFRTRRSSRAACLPR